MSSIAFYFFLLCMTAPVFCDLPRQLKEAIVQNDATCRAEELCTIVTALKRDVTYIATNVERQATYLKVMSVAIEDTISSTLDIHTTSLTDIGSKIDRCEKERKVQEEDFKAQTEAINDLSVRINDQSKVLGTLTLQEDFKELIRADKTQTEAINDLSVRFNDQSKVLETLTLLMNAVSSQLQKHSKDLLDHDNNLKAHDKLQTKQDEKLNDIYDAMAKPLDCREIRDRGNAASGVYRVYPGGLNPVDVYCDMTTPGGPWLVFQRRKDGSVNFERLWKEYSYGFGTLTGEFWLGNENLHRLTNQKKYKLRIELEDFEKQRRYAEYSTFSIGSSATKYQLTIAGYSGNAGDSLLIGHNGMKFTTKDADHDIHNSGVNCAQYYRGAWWYFNCYHSNLNGVYHKTPSAPGAIGVSWHTFRGIPYSLKAVEMKIALVN